MHVQNVEKQWFMNQDVQDVNLVDILNVVNMITVQLFYKEGSQTCEDVKKLLEDLKKDSNRFLQEEFNIDSQIRKENFYSNKVPFLLFKDEKNIEYATLYREHKSFNLDTIEKLIIQGYTRSLHES